MKSIIKLIRNENLKNISQRKTIVIMLIVLCSILDIALLNISLGVNDKNWREEQSKEIKRLERSIEENNRKINEINDHEESEIYEVTTSFYKDKISLFKYSIEKNIPISLKTPWTFVYEAKFTVNIIILFIIILSIHSITKEYSYETLKQIFIRPYKRWKIIFSKYCSVIYISLLSLVVHFIISFTVGYLFFGKNGNVTTEILISKGIIVERNIIYYIMQYYLLIFIEILVLSSLAMMLSVLIKKSTVPMLLTLLLWIGKGTIIKFTRKYFIFRFLLFNHLDLSQYILGESVWVKGNTINLSIIILILYILIFNFISYFIVTKQDIY